MFFLSSKVFTITHCNHPFWKVKFIWGILPRLVAEKVRRTIRSQNHESLSDDTLTYGEIITYINNEVLASLCTDIKLNNKIRYEKKETRRELGSLYAQLMKE